MVFETSISLRREYWSHGGEIEFSIARNRGVKFRNCLNESPPDFHNPIKNGIGPRVDSHKRVKGNLMLSVTFESLFVLIEGATNLQGGSGGTVKKAGLHLRTKVKLNGGVMGVCSGGEYSNVSGVKKPLLLAQVEGLQRGVCFALPRV